MNDTKLRLLVADGNIAAVRRRIAESAGMTPSESYAEVLRRIAPGIHIDVCTPADESANLPDGLLAYDGVVITGSALAVYERESAALRQIDFIRQAFAEGLPIFGSCWGLQLAAVAAGGDVRRNPRGREVAFARKVTLTEVGYRHPMHIGRAPSFDAPAIHGDEVVHLPADASVTAQNHMSQVQAAEIRCGKSIFWGVQYHPEYELRDVAAMVRRYGQRLIDEGFFSDLAELARYAADLDALHQSRDRRDIAWRFGLGDEILDDNKRVCEITNWLTQQVLPHASARR